MAKPKAKKAKSKAKKAPAKKKSKPAAKAKAKTKPKAATAKKPKPSAADPSKPQSEIEAKVAALLKSNDDGDIDNVYDIISELQEYDEQLPASSKLRPAWNAFTQSCYQIMMDVPLGEG